MINFEFCSPTKIIFGKGAENQVGKEIKALGHSKILVHFGGASAKKSGLLDRVYASLDAAGIKHVSLGGVVPNPLNTLVWKGVELAKKENVTFVLAVGGGSVIDSSKAICYGLANDFDMWDLFSRKQPKAKGCAPLGSILTIAAAGSESSNSCVITDEAKRLKCSYNDDISRPKFAIMNPELTCTLPDYQTMSGAVDILMHTMERYFTRDKNGDFIDRVSEGLLVSVIHNSYKLKKNPLDYDARAEIMWAGSVSHNGFTGTGRTGDFASHQMGHELSGMFDAAHGASLSVMWPSWARYVYKTDIPRFVQFAVRVMGCQLNFDNPEETAVAGIEAFVRFCRDVGMPVSISDLGIKDLSEKQIDDMVDKCTWSGGRKIGQFMKLDRPDVKKIYEMAK